MQPAAAVIAQYLGGCGIGCGIHRGADCGELLGTQGRRQGAERLKALEIVGVIKVRQVCFKLRAPRSDRPIKMSIKPIVFAQDWCAGKACGLRGIGVVRDKGQFGVAVDVLLAVLPIHKAVEIAFIAPNDVFAVSDLFVALTAPLG